MNEVAEDVEREERSEFCETLQELALDCLAIASQWRSVVEHFSQKIENDEDVDLRTSGDILRPVAEKTRHMYASFKAQADKSACGISQSDMTDILLAQREIESNIQWLSTWPTWDSTQRDRARQEYAECRPCCDH
ncbi:hypothetical protein [Schlesneria sp. T3-172]|uniref:hypothetical protein n=1 Tax=Schlesneria sphaerica TaxID=3373610 RepID=UPI0037C77004